MSLPAIEVSGLSKRYVIEHESRHDNLRDTLHHAARKLWRRARWGTGFEHEEFWALRDVSFTVQPGDVVGIIGRNGAGKSTLLKVLSRITEPTSGRVTLRGRVASLLEVGTGFHPDLSGRENIFLNGAILGMSRVEIRAKFDEIVAFAEVEQFIDTPVKRYSSGMYVRLAFAVAAHLEPEILIVDEVLAVGDAAFQRKCIGKMQSVSRQHGRTVLFVSHSLQAVNSLCSRALFMRQGQVVLAGSVSDASSAYLASFDSGTRGECWSGDCGDENVRVHQVRLLGREEGVFSTDRPIGLEIHATVLKPVIGLVVAAEVWSGREQLLAYSAQDDVQPPPAQTVAPGRYVWRMTVPPDTFASGTYEFRIDVGIHNVRRLVPANEVRLPFNCENFRGIGRRFQSGWTQLLRPAWRWETFAESEIAPTVAAQSPPQRPVPNP